MFELSKADVQDKEVLAIFRTKLLNLQKIFTYKENDIHSIFNQYQEMIWNDTVYRTFNEARRLSEIANSSRTGLPGTLIELIDKNFFDTQTMAIRRLTDPHEWRPKRSVSSLPSIIEEIRSFSDIFTRENYICYDGWSYDNTSLGNRDKIIHEDRNKQFDKIAVKSRIRSRGDMLDILILKQLDKEFAFFDTIRAYINKYVAHAASEESRYKIDPKLKTLTLQTLEDSYKKIAQIGKVLECILDRKFLAEVASSPGDQLENWDKPMVTESDHLKLYEFWEGRAKMFFEWDRN